ncbi:hypothetical protein [Arthrobacter oryzae]|jgi:hypothetical protein|uniref:hypothetical protein n=1 Tax=Arthrobacter oryzae TaxID=409290 RepID=UPI0027804446|nr:hypothetical protein [Arthrobacter oryzae]MDQ0076190.1 vacuolar-type H+-ATPase subunit I/STV1 [Arthrobacter oryzae]
MSRPERVVLGSGAVWLGILVTHVTFCLLLGANDQLRNSGSTSGVWFAVVALMVGAIPAVVIGWSLAMPLGLLLRPVSSHWIHVAAFGLLGVALGFPFGGFSSVPDYAAAAAMGAAAALGRLAVWKLAGEYGDGGQPSPGPEVP